MIALNQEQHLGKKAYLLMASRKMTAGLVILLVAAVLLALSGTIISLLAKLSAMGGASAARAAASTSPVVMGVVMFAFILALLALIVGLVLARLQYSRFTFTFEEFDLKLKRGILSVSEISIPYRQIQDINVEKSLLHQMTGTGRVIIDSAGHEEQDEHNETDIILDPVDKELAEEIRLMLQRKIGVQVVEGEKEADKEASAY